ncbi:MAG: hypothetical protein UW65_C0004G0002 [candidate division WWE3 bacterium GW2011_GWB1_44_4]|uniref:Uncharacterized protein n=1 Tax=candidate division WWE3 bacterium GW2011_GWB1_44_4 TaxID=1619116 RepID=A0A0G1MDL8_UNCKA|nr:MAG: hypothetical protein UW65_C0004G0002 [candidate division WWE3 bacterium GW2011_GWB1_44_4]
MGFHGIWSLQKFGGADFSLTRNGSRLFDVGPDLVPVDRLSMGSNDNFIGFENRDRNGT